MGLDVDSTELTLEEAGILYRDSVRRLQELQKQMEDLQEAVRVVEQTLHDEHDYLRKANKAVRQAIIRLPG